MALVMRSTLNLRGVVGCCDISIPFPDGFVKIHRPTGMGLKLVGSRRLPSESGQLGLSTSDTVLPAWTGSRASWLSNAVHGHDFWPNKRHYTHGFILSTPTRL